MGLGRFSLPTGGLSPFGATLIGVLTLVGAVHLSMLPGTEDFNGDEYYATRRIDDPLPEYLSDSKHKIATVWRVQYWGLHRTLGGSLAGYRLPIIALGVLSLLATVVLAVRLSGGRLWLPLFVCITLPYNLLFMSYFRYAIPSHPHATAIMSFALVLFVTLIERPISRILGVVAGVLLCYLPWAHIGFAIPYTIGVALVALFCLLRQPRSMRSVLAVARRLWFLGLPLVSVMGIQLYLGDSAGRHLLERPYNWPHVLETSKYSQDVIGALRFGWDNSAKLISELPRLGFPPKLGLYKPLGFDSVQTPLFGALFALGVASLIVSGGAARARRFVGAYLGVTALALYVLALLGLYAYGLPRYGLFLIVPFALIAAMGFDAVARTVISLFARVDAASWARSTASRMVPPALLRPQLLRSLVILLCVVAGGLHLAREAAFRTAMRAENDRILELLQDDQWDVVLLATKGRAFHQRVAPATYARGEEMGMPRQEREPSDQLRARLNDLESPVETVLVSSWQAPFTKSYWPVYFSLFDEATWKETFRFRRDAVSVSILQRRPGLQDNLIGNPGFESSAIPRRVEWTTEVVHRGEHAIRVQVDPSEDRAGPQIKQGYRSNWVSVDPSKALRAEVYARVDEIEGAELHLRLNFIDAAGKRVRTLPIRTLRTRDGLWTAYRKWVQPDASPADAERVALMVYWSKKAQGPTRGIAYVDDVSLTLLDPDPPPGDGP